MSSVVRRVAELKPISIVYFSDVLCVWAFLAELRLAATRRAFGDQVGFEYRFCSVFGDVPDKIAIGWRDRGGYEGFADHVQQAARAFPEVKVHPDLWRGVRPVSSLAPHLRLKAIQLVEKDGNCAPGTFERAIRMMREAFFVRGLDIARQDIHRDIERDIGLQAHLAQACLDDGRAHASLSHDYAEAESLGVKGSPTMILNQGRQKLFGNVGYRIIEANIHELLREPNPDQASWC